MAGQDQRGYNDFYSLTSPVRCLERSDVHQEDGMLTRSLRTLSVGLSILALAGASLACGSSRADELASALPPTEASGAEPTQPKTPKPTEPRSTPRPTQTKAPTEPPATATEPVQGLELGAQGFGQDDRQLGYGFLVTNPNTGVAIERTQYQVAAYDAEGVVLETDSGYIDVVFPGQTVGIGGTMFLDEGVTVAKIEAQVSEGDAEASDLTTTFEVSQVAHAKGDYFETARGVIGNPFTQDVSQLRVSAVAFDASGAVIGGGFSFLNFVQAGTTTGVEFSMNSAGDVARVELYPIPSGLSFFFTADDVPVGAKKPSVDKAGFGQDDRYLGYGALVTNPNADYALENTMFHVTYYGADDAVIGVDEGYLELLLPGQTVGLGGSDILEDGSQVARVDVQVLSLDYKESEALPTFTSENLSFQADRFSSTVTGQIVSPYTKDVTNIKAMAIAYNDAGDIIGGGFSYVDFVPAGGKAAVEVQVVVAGTPAKVDLYGVVSGLSDLK